MAASVVPTRMQQMAKSDRRMFSASDDSAMMRQIQATHSPDGRDVDVKPILQVIEDILHRATPPNIDAVVNGTHHTDHTLEGKVASVNLDGILDDLAYIIYKISCELSCKCSGGDAHATTMAILGMLSNYSWDAKVVISLAAFAVNYGEFWLVVRLHATHPLAKSVAVLKQMPDIIEHSNSLKSRFDAITNLTKAMVDVTNSIMEFKELPSQYISDETPPMSVAIAHIPIAAYWTIRSMVACAAQITGLLGVSYEYITSTTEAWEISSLAHKVGSIYGHLKAQLSLCYQHIDEKRHVEYFNMLVHLFEIPHLDNMKVLKPLIYSKDDVLPLLNGTSKTRVSIEVLRGKIVLLLISDLDFSWDELNILSRLYNESLTKPDMRYEVVWLPIVDTSISWNQDSQTKFEQLQSMMPWHTLHHPSLLEPAVTKYIKQVWHFSKRMILVALDPQGMVVCQNARHMVWIWGNLAYPFNTSREEELWREETDWKLELLVDQVDQNVLLWMAEGKFICLYGGEDTKWIDNFINRAREVARAAGIALQMLYVGKSSTKERVRRTLESLSADYWPNPTSVSFFWARLECMLYSKMEQGKSVESDLIMQEVMTMLSFEGDDQGWAMICKGSASAEIARAKGDMFLKCLAEYKEWEENVGPIGFVAAINEYMTRLHTPHHCNRLILPGTSGGIPERVVCAECGRPMEKYFMYSCCTD